MARVAVDVGLAHLDRLFDYAVPEPLSADAQPGSRVRVRFAGQDVDGYLLTREAGTDHVGALTPLRRVVSAEPVLTPEVLRLARAVADRYAGTLNDVLRLAVPPRHATVEKAPRAIREPAPDDGPVDEPTPDDEPALDDEPAWRGYPAGPAFLHRLAAGQSPRAVWTALPATGLPGVAIDDWTAAITAAVKATLRSGRGAVIIAPDRRDVDVLDRALARALTPSGGLARHVKLTADLGPAPRYRAFLAVLRGDVRVVVGTRAAAFAPVRDLGLVVIWDDGDEQHAEPRAPYPHAREVLVLRAEQAGAAMLIGGWSRSAEASLLVEHGWARELDADRETRRLRWPRVNVAGDASASDSQAAAAARMPPAVWRAVHEGLTRGPVLVQVARTGYLPGTACQTCRTPARCPTCHGPLLLPAPTSSGAQPAECGWCGRPWPGWSCPGCGGRRLRARSIGVERTAEELGRAFAGAKVVVCRADRVLPSVPPGRTLVLATPGVEPPVEGGYAAGVLLDGDVALERPDLRAGEEALRRWRGATALVRPASVGGTVVISADPAAPAVQALVRADPSGFAAREVHERAPLRLPPTVTAASLVGPPQAVQSLLEVAQLPAGTDLLGPVPIPVAIPVPIPAARQVGAEATGHDVRMLLRVPLGQGAELARRLHEALAVRSARRLPGTVRVQIDPRDLG